MNDVIKIALVDDHLIFRSGTALLLGNEGMKITLEAEHGKDMIHKLNLLKKSAFPDLFIVDINMPIMDGFETIKWLTEHYSNTKILILTMSDNHETVIKAIKLGVQSYLTKFCSPEELITAVKAIYKGRFYFPEDITRIIIESHRDVKMKDDNIPILTEREKQVLQLLCTEKTYSEIAHELDVSPRTIDAFRDSLFEKLKVKSRIGLLLFAMKKNWVINNDQNDGVK